MKHYRHAGSRSRNAEADRVFGVITFAMSLIVAVGSTSTLMAQTPVTVDEKGGGMLDWVVALGLAGIVCVAGFWNPKRSHQN